MTNDRQRWTVFLKRTTMMSILYAVAAEQWVSNALRRFTVYYIFFSERTTSVHSSTYDNL